MLGRRIRLSIMRRFIGDLVHAAKTIPSIPVSAPSIGPVVAAAPLRGTPPWVIIFLGYARVQPRRLVRALYQFPFHLGEYRSALPASHERVPGRKVSLLARSEPSRRAVAELTRILSHARKPLEEIRIIGDPAVSRLPGPFDAVCGGQTLAVNGEPFGNIAISVYSGQGRLFIPWHDHNTPQLIESTAMGPSTCASCVTTEPWMGLFGPGADKLEAELRVPS